MKITKMPISRIEVFDYLDTSLNEYIHITFKAPFTIDHGQWIRHFLQILKAKKRPVMICIVHGDIKKDYGEFSRCISNLSSF